MGLLYFNTSINLCVKTLTQLLTKPLQIGFMSVFFTIKYRYILYIERSVDQCQLRKIIDRFQTSKQFYAIIQLLSLKFSIFTPHQNTCIHIYCVDVLYTNTYATIATQIYLLSVEAFVTNKTHLLIT